MPHIEYRARGCHVARLRDKDKFALTFWREVQQQEVEDATFTGIPSKRLVINLVDFRNGFLKRRFPETF